MADRMIGRQNSCHGAVAQQFSAVCRAATRGLLLSVSFCLLPSAFCLLNAEELPDPTRPPAIIAQPKMVEMDVADNQPVQLRSIIISRTRRAAIIGDETVELGDQYGDAELVEVNETGVVLKSAQGSQVLTLFPGVRMTGSKEMMAKPQPAAGKVRTGRHKDKPVVR